jgi:protein-tyrosine phosphatase
MPAEAEINPGGPNGLPPSVSVIVPGELSIGARPDQALLGLLRRAGVSAVLSLQETHEAPPPPRSALGELLWRRAPLADAETGRGIDPRALARAVERLQRWRAEGRQIYVHCLHGVGRAPTVAAAYLVAEHGLSLGAALQRVKAARPTANLSAQQVGVLAAYATRLRAEPGR